MEQPAKNSLSRRLRLQEDQYVFPYHFIPQVWGRRYRAQMLVRSGHVYLSYLNAVLDVLAEHDWRTLLDVGCGDGRLVTMIMKNFPDRAVAGVDYSAKAIDLARAMEPTGNFHCGDICDEHASFGKNDVVTCVETMEHIDPEMLPRFVLGLRHWVDDNGLLVVTVPSTNLELKKKHFQHFTQESITAALAECFTPKRIVFLNGKTRFLKRLEKVLFNRYYTISHEKLLYKFFVYYTKNFAVSDARQGTRILGVFKPI
ncbi:MAG: class I SAM-dependent methyltransferase [Parvibaculum sp.]